MIILEYNNRILHDLIKERIDNEKPPFVDVLFSDFDGVKFHVWCVEGNHHILNISLQWDVVPHLLKNGSTLALKNAYGPYLQKQAEDGYDVTLLVDISTIQGPKKNRLPFHLSMLKRNTFAGPFQKHFNAAGKKAKVPKLEVKYRADESMWLVNDADRVSVIFNLRFHDADDQILGKVFVDQFVSTRGGMNAAPSLSFSLLEPPREVEGLPGVRAEQDQGWLTFVLHPRHTNQKNRGATINNIQQFRTYLHYHIKCSKAYMHTRMRERVRSLLQVLNRAKVEPLVKVKRTAKGKVFKRK